MWGSLWLCIGGAYSPRESALRVDATSSADDSGRDHQRVPLSASFPARSDNSTSLTPLNIAAPVIAESKCVEN